jgi:hypothetical protein
MSVQARKCKIYVSEYGPVSVDENGDMTYGDVMRYACKLYKISPEQVAVL